ncbi:MAG: hypothetical protein A2W91_20025 [Bacteroidetes bacterium GWF2_38_335]|nr:MAG: hypothetical protein A2W91_20025 [Bacteroidetes bacterium GWF2_38_335]OFY81993.1 MAG: hypothetical protein A2281_09895 [Bacteroidetes bacterium RIFOXYA12_FULL_38_20]HBS86508.1 aminodeoxychorismate synthase component I [Bacteroidales bacterium]
MRRSINIPLKEPGSFIKKLVLWSERFKYSAFLYSNNYYRENLNPFSYHSYDFIAGIDLIDKLDLSQNPFEELKSFVNDKKDWLFGHLSYDLKNHTEKLSSDNPDKILFPEISFFQPKWVFIIRGNELTVEFYDDSDLNMIFREVMDFKPETIKKNPMQIVPVFNKEEYLETVRKIKNHIQLGDIYEMNLCQEFYAENTEIFPADVFLKLTDISPTPFSCFYRINDKYLMCASPERFLKKTGNKIVSQPIKGTINRGQNAAEDEALKDKLFNDEKERAENVMIVDLVRNDLSKTAEKASVKVEELFGIYKFPQVFQMISTISSDLKTDVHPVDCIKACFPMGSMTGAPKIRAMELIEQYEKSKRGLYSGAVGYFSPDGDFDFNVVIRSILYNASNKYLSFQVGGAITSRSVPEKEYEECLLKAKALFQVLQHT